MSTFALLLLLQAALQPTPPTHEMYPIDAKAEACVEADSTTSAVATCADKAYEAWDKEMNSAYAALAARLSKAEKQRLLDSQRKWLAFRDSEFAVIDDIYYKHVDGTMYVPMRINDRTDLVRARAIDLRARIDILDSEFK